MGSNMFQKHIGESVEKFDIGIVAGLTPEPGQTLEDLIKAGNVLPVMLKFQILFYTETGVKDFVLEPSKMILLGRYITQSLVETAECREEIADEWLNSPNNPLHDLLKQHGYIEETQ